MVKKKTLRVIRKDKLARKALPLIIKHLKQNKTIIRLTDYVCVKMYQNGRESGYLLQISPEDYDRSDVRIWFSENRNSDHLVVYVTDENTFSDGLTDEAYNYRKYYDISNKKDVKNMLKHIETFIKDSFRGKHDG